MRHRFAASLGVLVVLIAVGSLLSVQVAGQASNPAAKTWSPPRTSDGHPDFTGTWTYAGATPGKVPMERGGMPRSPETGTRSLVFDPPDGRVPTRPEAETRRDYDLAHVNDSWEFVTPWERCITRGIPGSMIPANLSNGYQIVQSPGNVAILYEVIHDARIIPTDGSPHLPRNVHLWMGDARGRWEGDTLVVDTTNFNNKGVIASSMASGRIRGIHHSESLHVVERFTLTDLKTIKYEVTVDDPETYTRAWKFALNLDRDDGFRLFEYGCHEGNETYMLVTLGGGRAADKRAEQAK
jgi:hypothetical protein